MNYDELIKLSPKEIVAELKKLSDDELSKLLDEHPKLSEIVAEELYHDGWMPEVFIPELVRLTYRESILRRTK